METVGINVLGPLAVSVDGARRPAPAGPKLSKVLALLAFRVNQFVDVDLIADELWGDRPPRNAVNTVRTHLYHLRKALDRVAPGHPLSALVVTRAPGYSLQLPEEAVDAHRFRTLVAHGRRQFEQGRFAEATGTLDRALDLWDGPALADVTTGQVLDRYLAMLQEGRARAQELRIEAQMRLGRHRELIGELRSLVAVEPLNERLHAQLIDSLHRAGRRGEALIAYQHVRRVLGEELGLEPSAELRQLQYQVLNAS